MWESNMLNREYLLIQLIQECAEVQKAATKALLFGLQAYDEESGINYDNAHDIAVEFMELVAVEEMLANSGVLVAFWRNKELIKTKQNRVKKYMKMMRKKGTLV